MKPTDANYHSYAEYNVDSNEKAPKFNVGDHVRISKYKNNFSKGCIPNQPEEVFVIGKIKNTVPRTYVNSHLNGEQIFYTFYENELQKKNQKEFRTEKVIKRKGNKLYVKWKGYNNSFNRWIDKKDIVKWISFVGVELDLSSYATKAELKNATVVDTPKLAGKSDLVSLKAEIDKIDFDKLKTILVDLSELSNVVNNEVVKKTVYYKLVTKVNNIDTSGFVLKTKCNTDKSDL